MHLHPRANIRIICWFDMIKSINTFGSYDCSLEITIEPQNMQCPLWLTSQRALICPICVLCHYILSLRYVYEFARRHRNIPAGFVLNATQNHVKMVERCCHPAAKNSCFLQEVLWGTHFWLHSLATKEYNDVCEGVVSWIYLMLITAWAKP